MARAIDHRGCLSLDGREQIAPDRIQRIGRQTWHPHEGMRRHPSNRDAILLVERGNGNFASGDRQYQLNTGTLIARTRGQVFTMLAHSRLVLQMVAFNGPELGRLMGELCGDAPLVMRPRQVAGTRWQLAEMHRLQLESGPQADAICLHLLKALILGLQSDRQRDAQEGSAEGHYREYRAIARQHFRTLTTVGEWAEACDCSMAYLARLFARFGGSTPLRFLQELKVLEAENLLAEGDVSVAEIAGYLGFTDAMHFSKVFKRLTGSAPRDHRRAYRKPRAR